MIRYERRDKQAAAAEPRSADEPADVFYIGEDTPAPELPPRRVVPRQPVQPRRDDGDEGEVFYIGDE